MASIQEGQGLQQNPPAVDGSESIDSKISRHPSHETIFQSWSGPMIGGDASASVDENRIKTGSISNRRGTTHTEKETFEFQPLEEAVKGNSLSPPEISDPQKDTGCGSLEENKSLSHPFVQQKDEIGGSGCAHELSAPELFRAAIGGRTSDNTVDDMMSLSVPIKPELLSTTATTVWGGIGNDLLATTSGTCEGSAAPTQTITFHDDKGKNEPADAASTTESQEGGTAVASKVPAPIPPELKSELTDDLWELMSISQLTSQHKKVKGKAGGGPKPKVGPSDLWVKDDIGVSLALVNKLLELVSGQMTNAIKILRDMWCGCGTALKPRLPQHAPAIDWESVSKEMDNEHWTPKLCQAVWKYLAYADLNAGDLLANPSLAMKDVLEEDSDQDDFFVDSIKLNRRDASNNKRKRLWGRGIINWISYEGEDKGTVIALMQGPKKPKSRRRAAMSAHTAPCINLYPPVACGPQTSRKRQQTPATDGDHLLANVAKLPLPTPVPVLDIGMLDLSVQTPENPSSDD